MAYRGPLGVGDAHQESDAAFAAAEAFGNDLVVGITEGVEHDDGRLYVHEAKIRKRRQLRPLLPQKATKNDGKARKKHFFAKKKPFLFVVKKKGTTFALANREQRPTRTTSETLSIPKRKWSLRLSVRTRDFHSLKRSSTLLGTTIKNDTRREFERIPFLYLKKGYVRSSTVGMTI